MGFNDPVDRVFLLSLEQSMVSCWLWFVCFDCFISVSNHGFVFIYVVHFLFLNLSILPVSPICVCTSCFLINVCTFCSLICVCICCFLIRVCTSCFLICVLFPVLQHISVLPVFYFRLCFLICVVITNLFPDI